MRKKEIRDLIRRKGRKQQPWPLYTCQLLKLEEKHKFSNLEYSFDVTKANKIFDVSLKDKQITLSDDHKTIGVHKRLRSFKRKGWEVVRGFGQLCRRNKKYW